MNMKIGVWGTSSLGRRENPVFDSDYVLPPFRVVILDFAPKSDALRSVARREFSCPALGEGVRGRGGAQDVRPGGNAGLDERAPGNMASGTGVFRYGPEHDAFAVTSRHLRRCIRNIREDVPAPALLAMYR